MGLLALLIKNGESNKRKISRRARRDRREDLKMNNSQDMGLIFLEYLDFSVSSAAPSEAGEGKSLCLSQSPQGTQT
jgi:hypothetical protein